MFSCSSHTLELKGRDHGQEGGRVAAVCARTFFCQRSLCLFSCESALKQEGIFSCVLLLCAFKHTMVQGQNGASVAAVTRSPLVAKLPKLAKTGNADVDLENTMER